jgi:hypothetical protein
MNIIEALQIRINQLEEEGRKELRDLTGKDTMF